MGVIRIRCNFAAVFDYGTRDKVAIIKIDCCKNPRFITLKTKHPKSPPKKSRIM